MTEPAFSSRVSGTCGYQVFVHSPGHSDMDINYKNDNVFAMMQDGTQLRES